MIINDLIYQANVGKRKKARIACARRWAIGLCVVTTAASVGVVTGVLIAPKPGEEIRADLRKKVVKSVAIIEKEIVEKLDKE